MSAEKDRRGLLQAGVIGAVALAVTIGSGWIFMSMHEIEPIIAGPGVTRELMLSSVESKLAGTNGDTRIFELEGDTEGGTFLLLGGTHAQEISGVMASIIIIENASVSQGKLIVVPQANQSGFGYTDAMEAHLHSFELQTSGGTRWFRSGMRLTNPADQWPDPDVFVHLPSGERMVGHESRNLNRNHPGLNTGTLTGKVSSAITSLVRRSDIVLDLHEAQPEYPVNNMIITHQRAIETAAIAQMMLEMVGVSIGLNQSPVNLHGLSHREFGDFTDAEAVLAETPNPAMGRFRGRSGIELLVGGKDDNYVRAAELGRLFVPFDESGWPLKVRVARHLATFQELVSAFNETHPDSQILVHGLPSYDEIVTEGLGAFLNPPTTEG